MVLQEIEPLQGPPIVGERTMGFNRALEVGFNPIEPALDIRRGHGFEQSIGVQSSLGAEPVNNGHQQ